MPNLTRQEKWIIIFLAASILIGLGIGYFRKTTARIDFIRSSSPAREENHLVQTKRLININTAGFQELISLKGIGVKTAQRIIEYRNSDGPFFSIEDIQNVKGIGPKKFRTIKECITAD